MDRETVSRLIVKEIDLANFLKKSGADRDCVRWHLNYAIELRRQARGRWPGFKYGEHLKGGKHGWKKNVNTRRFQRLAFKTFSAAASY